MYRKFLIIWLALVLTTISASLAFAQKAADESTATLQETLSFVQNSIDNWGESVDGRTKNQFIPLKGCKIQLRAVTGSDVEMQELDLSDLDPITVKASLMQTLNYNSTVWIEFFTTSTKKRVHFIVTSGGKVQLDEMAELARLYILRDDEKMTRSNRIIRALQHAIKLCGGKIDPF